VLALHKIFHGLQEIFGLHKTSNISSFFVCFNRYNYFYFEKIIKYLDCVKILHEAKLQAFVKMQITRRPQSTKNLPEQKNLSRTEQRHVSRTAIKVNRTDTRLD